MSYTGNATVTILFVDDAPGRAFIFLPRFEEYNLTYSGVYKPLNQTKITYFYDRLDFAYEPGSEGKFEFSVSYFFPYASLMTEDKAWFMTPLIGAPNHVTVYVNVTLENLGKVTATVPEPLEVVGNKLSFRVYDTVEGQRVVIEYLLKKPVQVRTIKRDIRGTKVIVKAPEMYSELADRVLSTFERTKPYLDEIFGNVFTEVEYRFFLPRLKDVTELGYVHGEELSLGGEGPIYLNMVLLRYVPGYFEATVVHEYVHKVLAKAGIEPNNILRWFHEGVAEYVSLEVCKLAGIDVRELEQDRALVFREVVRVTGGDFGFLQNWASTADEGLKYAASEYLVYKLASKYGGLDFISRVVREARAKGKVATTDDLVEVLSRAAGEDLRPLFRSWGFVLTSDVEAIRGPLGIPLSRWIALAVIAVLVVVALVIVVRYARGRARREVELEDFTRCQYCGAIVERGAAFCPYCGREIEAAEELPEDFTEEL